MKQAAIACGSIANQAPASCRRDKPSAPAGRTTSITIVVATVALILVEGVALTLTLAALAERYLFPIQQD
jgi:hypothetical protein